MGVFTLRDPSGGSALRDPDNDTLRPEVPPPPLTAQFPGLSVELAHQGGWTLGESLLGIDTVLGSIITSWDEIGTFARHISYRRGRQRELDRVEAGRGAIRLANRDRRFDPTNTASPHYPDIRPMVPVRIRATWEGVTYPRLFAFAEGWPQRWTRGPQGDSEVELRLIDAFHVLSLAEITLSRPTELSGARITAVLDAISWPTNMRAIDAGTSTVQSATLGGVSALTHLQDVATSEDGLFFIADDGIATFYGSNHGLFLDEANDTWGDAGSEKDYEEVVVTYDNTQLWNEVTVTAPGLADQVASDPVSIQLFSGVATAAPRSLVVSTLLNTTSAMLARANAVLARYHLPKVRIEEAALDGRLQTQWPRLLVHDLHERVLFRKRPPGGGLIDQPSIIAGMEEVIVPNISWKTRWRLSSTNYQVGQWQLGVVGKSELGVTTTLVSS